MKIKHAFKLNAILVIYDRLCPPCYTTSLLKDGGLACIGPSYDENTEMTAFVSLFEHIDGAYMRKLKSY